MAMKKRYQSVGGRILSEKSGGVRVDYLTDALGSVTCTVDQSQNASAAHRYAAYGKRITASTPAQSFQWVGAWGYRRSSVSGLDYVRARHYNSESTNWTTLDFLPAPMQTYVYCNGRTTRLVDALGLSSTDKPFATPRLDVPFPTGILGCNPWTLTCKQANELVYDYCVKCWDDIFSDYGCTRKCKAIAEWYYRACKDPTRTFGQYTQWIPSDLESWTPLFTPKPGSGIVPFNVDERELPKKKKYQELWDDYEECWRWASMHVDPVQRKWYRLLCLGYGIKIGVYTYIDEMGGP